MKKQDPLEQIDPIAKHIRYLFEMADLPSEKELIRLFSHSPTLLKALLKRRENLINGVIK